jgi:hypothetical protein
VVERETTLRTLLASTAVAVALIACGVATQVPQGGQAVRVSMEGNELRLDPATVHPGDVYVVLEESAPAVDVVYRTADPNDPQSPPLPISDDDVRWLQQEGSFQGAIHAGLGVGGYGNVFKVGPLSLGNYALMVDRNEEPPTDPSLISVSVLEVGRP